MLYNYFVLATSSLVKISVPNITSPINPIISYFYNTLYLFTSNGTFFLTKNLNGTYTLTPANQFDSIVNTNSNSDFPITFLVTYFDSKSAQFSFAPSNGEYIWITSETGEDIVTTSNSTLSAYSKISTQRVKPLCYLVSFTDRDSFQGYCAIVQNNMNYAYYSS